MERPPNEKLNSELIIYKIESLEAHVNEIGKKLDLQFVTREKFDALEEIVKGHTDINKWLVRLILGAIISAVIGLVIIAR